MKVFSEFSLTIGSQSKRRKCYIEQTIQKPDCIVIAKNSIIKKPSSPHPNDNFIFSGKKIVQCLIFICEPDNHDTRIAFLRENYKYG